jgi:hypothetical protein
MQAGKSLACSAPYGQCTAADLPLLRSVLVFFPLLYLVVIAAHLGCW